MKVEIRSVKFTRPIALFLVLLLFVAGVAPRYRTEQQVLTNPILFALVVPQMFYSISYGHQLETFGNHLTDLNGAPRGGDLGLMTTDGNVRLLTEEAGFGVPSGEIQAENAIAVRQPCVHWSGDKALFSMVMGGPIARFDGTYRNNKWQIYEITNLDEVVAGMAPNIVKVPNQPDYHNISPIYGSDDQIIFTSDKPLHGLEHTYPQLDEYESTPINTGIFKLNPETGRVVHLTHSPSGDFDIHLASDGRIISTRWEHLKRDQQADAHRTGGNPFGPVNFDSERSSAEIIVAPPTMNGFPHADSDGTPYELFPEARGEEDPTWDPNEPTFDFNEFLPWEITENGERHQTMNHVGRHEFGGTEQYPSKLDDPNLVYGLAGIGGQSFTSNVYRGTTTADAGIFQIKEDPRPGKEGTFYGVWSREFVRFSSGRVFQFSLPIGANPQDMEIIDWTNEIIDSSGGGSDRGHFRNPLMTMDGTMLVSYTPENGVFDVETDPYRFRIAKMIPMEGTDNPTEHTAGEFLTKDGFTKEILYWQDEENPRSATAELHEVDIVEVVPRPRPTARPKYEVADVEMEVINEEGVDVEELRQWMIDNNLALIAIRNATERDQGEAQQPFNLRVPDGVSSIPAPGKVYDISHLQIFGAELLRAYNQKDFIGRRVLATPLRNTEANQNIEAANGFDNTAPEGSAKIFPDGSIAAFVPATRALTWQTIAPDPGDSPIGVESVVRERQWLTFAPGEIRTCEGCHGINNKSHLGNDAPTNKPEALRALLTRWKNLFGPNPLGARSSETVHLFSITPNPIESDGTSVSFILLEAGSTEVAVYDMLGKRVRTLKSENLQTGQHDIAWDGKNEFGVKVYPGTYIVRINKGNQNLASTKALVR